MEEQFEVEKAAAVQVDNVRASKPDDAEVVVIGKERWEEIQRRKAEGATTSAIARETGLDRKTVRRCLRQKAWTPYQRRLASQTLLTAHMDWLIARAPAVLHSARILYQELCKERGYAGSYDTVRNAVQPLRLESSVASLTQCRFETEPGEQAQVDWGQAKVSLGGERQAVHIFVLTLGYSRRAWAEGYETEQMGALMSAHEHAFAHFGGVTREILYDRMRTVLTGTGARWCWNPRFEAFARHWGFQPRVCRPYRAQTKGKVESGVKYVKRNFLPGRSFRDMDDFNEQLRTWLAEIADLRLHGTTHERPIDRFARETGRLTPLAGRAGFLEATPRARVVADDWLVAIDSNRYSVPWRLVGQTVEVVRVGGSWHIHHRGQLVAEHAVLAGRHQLSVKPEHGPGAISRNARQRHAGPSMPERASERLDNVEVRDLSIYDQLLEAA